MSKARALDIITKHNEQSNYHCGLTAVQLAQRMELPLSEIKALLLELYNDGKIEAREGIHRKLIFNKRENEIKTHSEEISE